MEGDRYLINSVLRSLQILEAFTFEKSAYTNAELSKLLGLNKSTVTRLLYSMEKARFLKRDPKSLEYSLTHRVYRIGCVYMAQVNLLGVAGPLLYELVSECQETVQLGILDDFEVLFIDKVEGPQPISMRSYAGAKLPTYCTGIGKMLLAHLEKDALKEFFRSVRLERLTPNTITAPETLEAELQKIRERGYAIDNVEYQPELKSVAAPVLDRRGRVVAAISIAGPVFRMMDDEVIERHIAAIRRTAATLSRRMGFVKGQSLQGVPGREASR